MVDQRKGWYDGRNQLHDTFPGQYMSVGQIWDTGKKRFERMLKGAIVALVGGTLAIATLVWLPLNLFTGIIIAFFLTICGIGIGQVRIQWWIFSVVDSGGACLQWPQWPAMGGVDMDQRGKKSGVWNNK